MDKESKDIKICSDCKTGKESILLDRKSEICPYAHLNDGEHCLKYVKLEINK